MIKISDSQFLYLGNILAQIMPVLITPALTRIYDASDLGIFSIIYSTATVLAIIITGRLELAYVKIRNKREKILLNRQIAGTMWYVSVIFSLCLMVLLTYPAGERFLSKWFEGFVYYSLLVLPLAVLLGISQVLNYESISTSNIRNIRVGRTYQGLINAVSQLSLSSLSAAGMFMAQCLSLMAFINRVLNKRASARRISMLVKIKKSFQPRFSEYYYKSLPGAFFDVMTLQLPIFFIGYKFGGEQVGYFALAFRILSAPITFIGKSMSQLLLAKLTVNYHVGADSRQDLGKGTLKLLTMSLLMLAVVITFPQVLFEKIFGVSWGASLDIMKVLVVSMVVKTVASPLSVVLTFPKNLVKLLIFQVSHFAGLVILIYFSEFINFNDFLWKYVIYETCSYIVYFILIYVSIGNVESGEA